MHRPPFDAAHCSAAIDWLPENTEDARQDVLSDRRSQRRAGVLDRVVARQSLRRRESNAADAPRVQQGEHFDDNSPSLTSKQDAVDMRQLLLKKRIHNTPAHREHLAEIRRQTFAFRQPPVDDLRKACSSLSVEAEAATLCPTISPPQRLRRDRSIGSSLSRTSPTVPPLLFPDHRDSTTARAHFEGHDAISRLGEPTAPTSVQSDHNLLLQACR